eukprot:3999598-Amphidinium_carterae.2
MIVRVLTFGGPFVLSCPWELRIRSLFQRMLVRVLILILKVFVWFFLIVLGTTLNVSTLRVSNNIMLHALMENVLGDFSLAPAETHALKRRRFRGAFG